jgi:hypothetical protein
MTTLTGAQLRLAEQHGPVLSGRVVAMKLRSDLEYELGHNGVAVLDFEGVEAISPSFADELFNRLVDQLGEDRVEFANLNEHLRTVAMMVRRRAGRAAI